MNRRADPPAWLVTIVWLAGFFLLWNLIALLFRAAGQTDTKFPFLHLILKWAFSPEYDGSGIWRATAITLSVFAKGLAAGFFIGALFAVLMSACGPVEKVGYPLLLLSQMIPMLGLAPIIVSMVGNFSTSKFVMSAYMTFFPVAANMFAGLQSVDAARKELLVMASASPATIYRKLMLPASLPSLFIGLKLAAPAAFAAVIFTEVLYPQNGGIGGEILNSQYGNDWELCWGYIFMAVLVAVVLFYAVSFLEKAVIRWKTAD
ncbi:MAG: ABC transporter permease subunit [Oscillospiraceae bacterium]|nr:ABC transporter permease subunit [Oscillospiraceae bacterium]MCD7934820.1 ABC transporter permease subunit [Oscillospiraceae bacterium]